MPESMEFSSSITDSFAVQIQGEFGNNTMVQEAEYFMPLQDERTGRQAMNRVDSGVFEDSSDERSRATSISFPNSSETLFPVDFNLTTQLMFERINGALIKSSINSPTSISGRNSAVTQLNGKVHELDCSRSSVRTRDTYPESDQSRRCYELDRSRSSVGTRDSFIESDYVIGASLEQDDEEYLSDDLRDKEESEDVDECIFDLEL